MPINTVHLERLSPTEDVLARVKRETQQQHRLVESLLPIGSETFCLSDYRLVVEKFLGLYLPLEATLNSVPGLPAELKQRLTKSELLKIDLAALHLTEDAIRALPVICVEPVIHVAEALGAMYVLEGSTLGGQFISRIVTKRFGFSSNNGCAFFNSYGDDVGSMWRAFGDVVRQHVTTPAEQQNFITGAKQAFSYFEQWLRETHV